MWYDTEKRFKMLAKLRCRFHVHRISGLLTDHRQDNVVVGVFPFDDVAPLLSLKSKFKQLIKSFPCLSDHSIVVAYKVGKNLFRKTYLLQSSRG